MALLCIYYFRQTLNKATILQDLMELILMLVQKDHTLTPTLPTLTLSLRLMCMLPTITLQILCRVVTMGNHHYLVIPLGTFPVVSII